MQTRSIIFAAASVLVLGCAIALVVKVRGKAEVSLSEEQLARARANYARIERRRAAPPRAVAREAPPAPIRPRARPKPPTPEPEPAPAPPPPRRMPGLATTPSDGVTRGVKSTDYDDKRAELTRIYTANDYASSLKLAQELLVEDPGQTTLMRVVVVSACAEGQLSLARQMYEQLDLRGRRGLVRRCRDVGETLLPSRGAPIR